MRRPGPRSLLNEPLETVLLKPSSEEEEEEEEKERGSVRSISMRRGRRALFVVGEGGGEGAGEGEAGHCRKSYTSSEIINASCWRARETICSRWGRDMVLPEGLEKVGTQ